MCTIAGNKNAKVFPEPVYAIPIKSCPLKTIGNAFLLFLLFKKKFFIIIII